MNRLLKSFLINELIPEKIENLLKRNKIITGLKTYRENIENSLNSSFDLKIELKHNEKIINLLVEYQKELKED